jgi:hypothetical protein
LGGVCGGGGSQTIDRTTLEILTWCFLGGAVIFWIVVILLIFYVPKVSVLFYGYKKMTDEEFDSFSAEVTRKVLAAAEDGKTSGASGKTNV